MFTKKCFSFFAANRHKKITPDLIASCLCVSFWGKETIGLQFFG